LTFEELGHTRGWLVLAAALSMASTGARLTQNVSGPVDAEAGIAGTLARDRAARISGLRYDLAFFVPSDRRAPVEGQESMTFDLGDAARPLVVDFDPHRAKAVRTSKSMARRLRRRRSTATFRQEGFGELYALCGIR
jgi:hypothetical protein